MAFCKFGVGISGCCSPGCGLAVPSCYVLATSQRRKILGLGQCFGVSISFRLKKKRNKREGKGTFRLTFTISSFQSSNQANSLAAEPGLTNCCNPAAGCSVSSWSVCRGGVPGEGAPTLQAAVTLQAALTLQAAIPGFRRSCCSVSAGVSLQGQAVLFPQQSLARWLL